MRTIVAALAAMLALTFAVGPVAAQDKDQKKKGKQYRKHVSFKPLGKDVALSVTAKGEGGELTALLSTASNRYEAFVTRQDRRRLNIDGIITVAEEGGYLVSYNIYVSRRVKGEEGWTDVSFSFKGSALLKDGEEQIVGSSDDYSVRMKVSE
jgi:hypothetical protein